MATRDIKNIKDHLICAICLECLTDPRKLPCDHSFCLLCLKKHISEARKGNRGFFRSKPFQSFTCPSCRTNVKVQNSALNDDDIAKGFPANALLADIEKRVKLHESSVPSCEKHIEIPAEYFCVKDNVFLCTDCAVTTHRGGSCKILSLHDASIKLRPEYNSIKQQYEDELNEMSHMITKEYKEKVSKQIKLNTLKDLDSFEKQIGLFYQKALQNIEDLRNKIDASSCTCVSTYDSQIRELIRDTEKRKKNLDEMDTGGGFLLHLQKFKRNNKTFITDVKKKLASFSETILVRSERVNTITKYTYSVVGLRKHWTVL
ncbi:E3 ubiquitin-protein ligase TRIM13-like [Mytilus californianus]|uniref:E3 ubiquitin-protein ligase TRIM13-like n=1 Tax=Mytilus californianus TaxID=6549 RepID=UPI002245EA5D|nr:E3 ubiquitin-protein ligase TRIM13-like [Mytilus californianus]